MAKPASPAADPRKHIWRRVYQELVKHAKPDSRFNYDFMSFTPDFLGSSTAVDRLASLSCYKDAKTILVTSDNSLEELRYRALKDGKKLVVGTYRLRRGFVLLDPAKLEEKDLRSASWLDGMERFGMGRNMTLAQMQDAHINVDLGVLGALAINTQGVVVWEGNGLFEVQWALLQDMKVVKQSMPVAALAHACQVVDEDDFGVEKFRPEKKGEVQCDFIVTPEKIIEVKDAVKPEDGIVFEVLDPEALQNIPPLQELKGIRMMEQIMKDGNFGNNNEKVSELPPSADEQAGISMVERIMKGFGRS